jgi:hypothetical protein
LLRTVGHVLAKSDALKSAKHKIEIDKLWIEWKSTPKENAIFWNFIEEERNNILKAYTFGATLANDGNGLYVSYLNGEDAFQLFGEAVYWWRHQLSALEERL